MHPQDSGLDQAAPMPDPREQRLGRFLIAAAKAGCNPEDIRELLLPLQVDSTHSAAAPVQVRLAYQRNASTIYVDTARLPRDVRRPA